jgi:hypothetical protein
MRVAQSQLKIGSKSNPHKDTKDISINSRGKIETLTSRNRDIMFLLFRSRLCCFAMFKQANNGYKAHREVMIDNKGSDKEDIPPIEDVMQSKQHQKIC